MENLEEKLQQCSGLIEWHSTFDAKYKESLNFIGQKEQFIDKYCSDSLDPATQLDKCSVSVYTVDLMSACVFVLCTTGIKAKER